MGDRLGTEAVPAQTGSTADGTATFGIHLFGQPRFTLGGQPYSFHAPPRTLPLLAYLLLHRGAHLTRESIALALWPDDAEDVARVNLRRHLHHLKETLPEHSTWFMAERETIGWVATTGFWFDVEAFERAFEAGRLEEAVDLYTGDLLPPVYDDWLIAGRDRLHAAFVDALERLLTHARSRRQFSKAANYARRILSDDPWREDILRQLVSVRYESGDRTGALREFESFARRLQEEMSAEPMVESLALRDIVLRGGVLPEHPDVAEPLLDEHSRTPALPFVGRTAELDRLRAAWTRAAQGNGSFLLVGGEAGIGKSRIAAELALFAHAQGGRVLRGSTARDEQAPYQAIREALRDAAPMLGSLDAAPVWLSAIGVLVPDVAASNGWASPSPLSPAREQQRLFEALSETLDALAAQRPLLVVLEDLHWAGASSLAALEFIARRAAAQPLLVVGTYRSEAVVAGDPLPALRRRLTAEHLVGHVPLGGLSRQEVGELVGLIPEFAGRPAELALAVAEESGGNPLFVNELLRNRLEGGRESEVPRGISATIAARAERLSAPGRLLAEIASVVGEIFDVEYVREISGYDENAVLDGLSELIDRRMIRESSAGQFEFGFAHQVIHETIYQGADARRRARWHRRMAGILERLAPSELEGVLGVLARHLEQAGEQRRAAQRYLEAATHALALFAHDEAIRAATRGIELATADDALRFELLFVRQLSNNIVGDAAAQQRDLDALRNTSTCSDDRARSRILDGQAQLSNTLGDRSTEKQCIDELAAVAEALNDDGLRVRALRRLARFHWSMCQFSESRAAIAAAAGILGESGEERDRFGLAMIAGESAALLGDPREAGAQVEIAAKIARATGRADLLERVAFLRTIAAMFRHDLDDWLESGFEALELSRSTGDRFMEAEAHSNLIEVLWRFWRIEEARSHIVLARELFEAVGNNTGIAQVLTIAGRIYAELGCVDDAASLTDESVRYAKADGAKVILDLCVLNTMAICALRGDAPGSLRAYEDGLPFERERYAALGRAFAARAKASLGEFEAAIAMFEGAISELRDNRELAEAYDAGVFLADAYLSAARVDDARSCAAGLMHDMEEQGERFPAFYRPRILWIAGRVASATGETDRASALFTQARSRLEELHATIPDAQTRDAFLSVPLHRRILVLPVDALGESTALS